jgi:RNA polymerase sigma-70 factor (ECF subfamily)
MHRLAYLLLHDDDDSKDVVHDVFAKLLVEQTELRETTVLPFLLSCVRNQCLKRLRHARLMREVNFAEAPADEDERLTDIVEFVVSHLSRQEQRIFNMRFTGGCTYEEIAAEEGISRVAVWKHLAHIITLIKQRFNPR